jgi:ribosomal protein L10
MNELAKQANAYIRKEMQAKLVGPVAAPMTHLVGVMNQKICSLLYVLNAAVAKKEQVA